MNILINKKLLITSFLVLIAIGTMTGCGESKSNLISEEISSVERNDKSPMELNSVGKDENIQVQETQNVNVVESDIKMIPLPEGIKGRKAESQPNVELQQLIIKYFEIPKEYYETTRYYYNYIDLDEDGVEDIFAVVMGPYTSGTGGSSALWVNENNGILHVNQDFTLVNTPVIISDKVTNGARDLIVPYYGGGAESQYSILTCNDGFYQRVSDGKMVKTLVGITGDAIIANDISSEIDAGIMGLNLMSK